jgi:hypothetical protein
MDLVLHIRSSFVNMSDLEQDLLCISLPVNVIPNLSRLVSTHRKS